VGTYRDVKMWQYVPPEQWNDWKWQFSHRLTTLEQLKRVVPLTPDEVEGAARCLEALRMAITPYYASLIDPDDPQDPVRRQAIPSAHELHKSPADMDDPLNEDVDSPVPGLTHRYPDRVLLLVTDQCANYCRHCTRRRLVGVHDRATPKAELDAAIDYIKNTPAVRDVLISGGDPLTLQDDRLEAIIKRLREIPHVEVIRIGTRIPVVMPQRVTPALCAMLAKYHPVWVNLHFNHPKELTPEALEACARLADSGIPLGNQTVLLKGINDCPVIMRELVRKLVAARIRPYYIYQCDLSWGLEHFRTSVKKGLEIMEMLRGHVSGFAVPTYVIDAPAGGGKIPIMPQYLLSMSDTKVVMRNYEGVISVYTEPEEAAEAKPCPVCGTDHKQLATGIGKLLYGDEISLEPSGGERDKRRLQRKQPAKRS
jgi:lysine 2,3-aminomutase